MKWDTIFMDGAHVIKMTILPKLMHRFSAFPIKFPIGYLMGPAGIRLKCTWKNKGPGISKPFLKREWDFPTMCWEHHDIIAIEAIRGYCAERQLDTRAG